MHLAAATGWMVLTAFAQEPQRSKLDPLPDGEAPPEAPEEEPKLPWVSAWGTYDPALDGSFTGWTAGADVAAGRGASIGLAYGQTAVGDLSVQRLELPLTYNVFGFGRSISIGLAVLALLMVAFAEGGAGFGALLGGELGVGLPGPLFATARGGYLLADDQGALGPLVGPTVRVGGGVSVTRLVLMARGR